MNYACKYIIGGDYRLLIKHTRFKLKYNIITHINY